MCQVSVYNDLLSAVYHANTYLLGVAVSAFLI